MLKPVLLTAIILLNFSKTSISFRVFSKRTANRSSITRFASMIINFDNRNLKALPLDPKKFVVGNSRQVPNAIFSPVDLQPVANPQLIAKSDALSLLGIPDDMDEKELAKYLGGNELIPGSEPAAHCYCGHQFGSFAGQLGDGAAMYLGEVVNSAGQRWELQLKGSGKTPYSRTADGRKVLRSSVREFLCSEAMHYLGVPTTRAGSCVTSDSTVERDPYYDGHPINERCTIISRIAPNFFRFGSFEVFKSKGASAYDRAGPSAGNDALKKILLDHIISSYYPALLDSSTSTPSVTSASYLSFFRENVRRTALLVAQWQGVGFVHGVLNTDNMSLMGLTVDYGPFAFLDQYDTDFTPNGSDGSGRYTYAEQPKICRWNLGKLAEALAPLVPLSDTKVILAEFDTVYADKYKEIMMGKLGLGNSGQDKGDMLMLQELLEAMSETRSDFTDTFRALTAAQEALLSSNTDPSAVSSTLVDLLVSRSATPADIVGSMQRKMRIHRVSMPPQQIEEIWSMLQQSPESVAEMFGISMNDIGGIREEIGGEKKKLDKLIFASQEIKRLEMLNADIKATRDRAVWELWVGKYMKRVLDNPIEVRMERVKAMNLLNPTFILRNWVAEAAIQAAEKGDFAKVRTVLSMLKTPYDESFCSMRPVFQAASCALVTGDRRVTGDEREFLQTPPAWAASLLCTCSS